jgi:Protein of unknown function (DUF3105)
MAEKPRVKAPKQRGTASEGGRNTRTWAIVAGIVGLVVALGVVAAALGFVGGGGGGKTDIPGLRTTMQKAGCTLQVAPALEGVHSITDPSKTSPKWNTDPPTSGPHYAVPAVFGIYEEPIELARLVHNLEHGGIYILYGKDVPDSTVEQLRSFYEHHKTGTIMAPLDRLGDKIALGAWVVDGDTHNGFLAKCASFDENAFGTFFRTLQFRGPERFDPSQLRPGM